MKEFLMNEPVAKNKGFYITSWVGCHQLDGQGIAGAFPAIFGSSMVKHIDIVVNGKAGTSMQALKDQLSVVYLAAVVTYQRNALGNSMDDFVQPSAI